MAVSFKDLYQLDPGIVFLNHGSFGATPKQVFEEYQTWQRKLENQPVQFLATDLYEHLENASQVLAGYLHTSPENIAYLRNATIGINIIAQSIPLSPGDEILSTNHIYGACENIWGKVCSQTGARLKILEIPFLFPSYEETIDIFWRAVTPRTKVIFLSHIASPTGLIMPVGEICRKAREAGILTIIDGAHALGQLSVDLDYLEVDFYVANCHKWLCAPKGSALLFARPEVQHMIQPLIVSWGWGKNHTISTGSSFLDMLVWMGTEDPSAYLSVPAAIHFQEKYNWDKVRVNAHNLVTSTLERIHDVTDLPILYRSDKQYAQMASAQLPDIDDLPAFKKKLYDKFRVEIPCIQWGNHQLVRVSIQAYNSETDVQALVHALEQTLKKYAKENPNG